MHNKHLPADYFQGMLDTYDETMFKIYVQGKTNMDIRDDYVYNKFTLLGNVLEEKSDIDPTKDYFWALDFNLKPQCSIIGQYEEVDGKNKFIVKDEIVMFGPTMDNPYGGANVVDVANEFVRRYKPDYLGQTVFIFCDPHGWGGQTSRELTRPAQIIRILEGNGFFCEMVTDTNTMPIKERTDTMNHACEDGFLLISPNCEHTIKSLEELKWKDKSLRGSIRP